MNFEFTEKVRELQKRVTAFMDEHVYPNEHIFHEHARGHDRWQPVPIIEELKPKARAAGLWNLFPHGLTNLEYAPLCEIMGRSPWARRSSIARRPIPAIWKYWRAMARPSRSEQWLVPLLEGEIRSCFCMTEPAVASSDATNIHASIVRDGDEYVLNGRKWWSSGAGDPRCKIAIFMGKTDPAARAAQATVDDPGADGRAGLRSSACCRCSDTTTRRTATARVVFDNVRVPAANMLLGEGRGFEIAQGRLGPGRIHHCMRLIGVAERALEDMCRRAKSRVAFGRTIAEHGTFRADIADSRIEIEQARLLTLKAAWMMDTVGNKAARSRDRHDQSRGAQRGAAGASTGPFRRTAAPAYRTTSTSPPRGPIRARCVWPTARTKCIARPSRSYELAKVGQISDLPVL